MSGELAFLSNEGYSLVPARGKRPLVPWGVWQDRRQTTEEVTALPAGDAYGIVTGSLYDLVVLDFDGPDACDTMLSLGLEPNVRTARGFHVWFHAPGYEVKTVSAVLPGVDLRGEGGLEYVWSKVPGKYEILSTTKRAITDGLAHLFPERRRYDAEAPLGAWDGDGAGTPAALRVLEAACSQIRSAPAGTSNSVTNTQAFTVGGLVGSGELDGQHARLRLTEAAYERGVGNPQAVIDASLAAAASAPWSSAPVLGGEEFEPVSRGPRPAAIAATVELPPAPDFPIDVLPPAAASYARQAAAASGSSVGYTASCLLPMFGTAVGGRGQICVDGDRWYERPAVWVVLVGDPGSSKSPAMKEALAPARTVHRQLMDFEDSPNQLFLADTTIEGAFFAFQKNPRGLLLYQDELIGWINSMAQYKQGKGSDRQHWLSMWSGEDVTLNRAVKGGTVRFIREPFLNAVGGIQPEVLEQLATDVQDGLGARLLLVPEGERRAKVLRRPKMDQRVADEIANRWHDVRDSWDAGGTAQFSAAGFDVFADWYEGPWSAGFEGAAYPGIWAKMSAHAARLAFILSQVREPGTRTVDAVDARGAITLVHYYYETAVVLYSSTRAASAAERQYRKRLDTVRAMLAENPKLTRLDIIDAHEWAQGFVLDQIAGDLGRPDLRSAR